MSLAPVEPATPASEAPRASPAGGRAAHVALALLPLALLAAAGLALHRELRTLRWHEVWEAIAAIPPERLALALGVVAANYLALTLYDVVALRHLGRALPYRRVGLASFVGYAFGHNVGFAFLSGGSVRLRLLSGSGLGALDVAQLMAVNGITFWAGLLASGGAALALGPHVPGLPLPFGASRALGSALCAAVAAYVLACARVRGTSTVRGVALRLPSWRLAIAQVAVSSVDWLLAAIVPWLLFPAGLAPAFAGFLVLFLAAQLAGLFSQVPGGVGVFDALLVAALSPAVPAGTSVALLLAYRAIYYLVPFVAAALLLAWSELIARRTALAGAARAAHASLAPVVPWLASAGAFVAGAVLLFSGATPTVPGRLALLERVVPLAAVETSHLVGSLAGIALLLLARALLQRLDGAWAAAMALLLAGGVASLVKGVDYEEAGLLFALALALAPFRAQFYRRASLLAEPLDAGWLAAVAAVAGASVWLGLVSYRHVEYAHELFWRFAFAGDAPRFLRATVASGALAAGLGVAHLLRPAPARAPPPCEDELARVRPLVARAPEAQAHLALVGDKAFLFDPGGAAFLMYGVAGRAWVSMGDPVGPPTAATELAWAFRELADRHHGWTCFYEVGPGALPRYLDLGLALLKLGEEATVPLAGFELASSQRRPLRQTVRRLEEREGCTFEVAPAAGVAALLPELKRVSDAWLGGKSTREKGFSLGRFDPRYLAETPAAVVRRRGEVVAFANVWAPEARAELSLDLMRFSPDAPRGAMEYLFTRLMIWGREQGYAHFNLGMAPLSGLEARALAPAWHRLGAFLFRHGEHFYNFQGLRQYKEKFHPEWTPRFLAAPGGLALPRVLAGVAALVNRGVAGVVTR